MSRCLGAARCHHASIDSNTSANGSKSRFRAKSRLLIELIQSFEPVAGTLTHVLLDSWYSAKAIWKAGRCRGFLITTGLKCNRSLRIEDESQPNGWRWQRLDAYAASLSAEDYTQLRWPRGEEAEPVYVHVVSTPPPPSPTALV